MTKQITLQNYEIVDLMKLLDSPEGILNSTDSSKKLPIAILWKINKNVKAIKRIYETIQDMEQSINNEYFNSDKSEPNDEGLMQVKLEYRDEFLSKKNDLMSITNDISLDMIDLASLEGFNFVPADFKSIEMMIAEPDDGPEAPIE